MKRARPEEPLLLIVTSKSCHACEKFKENILDQLLVQLENTSCAITHVDLEDFSTRELPYIAPEVPPEYISYITWFPTLLLFSSSVHIFNGKIRGGKAEYVAERPFTAQSMSNWVKENL